MEVAQWRRPAKLSEAVLTQRRLLERILAHGRRETGEAERANPDAGDAEFVKNLQIFLRLVVDADALSLRAAHNLGGDAAHRRHHRPPAGSCASACPPHRCR